MSSTKLNAADPVRIGTKTAKNRITMAPTVKFAAGEDGCVTPEFVAHYEDRAKHECGFICVEATCVNKNGRLAPSQLGLWDDSQIEGHKRLTDACHKYGALVVPQLHHGGVGTHPACGEAVGPSEVMWGFGPRERQVRALSVSEIKQIVDDFAKAAERAKKAGYDGVQLHGCHAYLINDFASDLNHRDDEYGGDIKGRAKFGCDVIKAIREVCGKDFIISMRTSGYDPNFEDAIAVAEEYVAAGCDYLQVSSGIASLENFDHDESLPYNFIADLGVRFHEHFKGRVPVSCVNGFTTAEQVNYIFENDLCDTVDLARGLLADPALSEGILHGAPYFKCLNCKKSCAFGPQHEHVCPGAKQRGADEFPGIVPF